MQMQLSSDVQIPEGLLAANALLAENSRQGFGASTHTLYQGFEVTISSTALGISGTLYDGRVRCRYTGKERDTESGNDYFLARYYNSATGRFLSPDWDAKSSDPVPYAKLDNPQTLNLYSYVGNDPLGHVDLNGHAGCALEGMATSCNGLSNNEGAEIAQNEGLVIRGGSSAKKATAKQKWSPYIAVGDNGRTGLVNGHRGRDEIYDVRQFFNGSLGPRAQDHTLALHETLLSGTLGPHASLCTSNNCSGRGEMVDSQGISYRDSPLVIRRDWTIDNLPARVWDPNSEKPASYQILHLQVNPDFVMEYKP
jgi:RHS repeat-associated protein